MNMYGGPIEEYFNENDITKGRRDSDSETGFSKYNAKRPDGGENALSDEQIEELRSKYDLICMSCEEEESLLRELSGLGILAKEDCKAYKTTGGNIFESLSGQISADINRLYKMAIAGRYSSRHIEHIRSQQKILEALEQLVD